MIHAQEESHKKAKGRCESAGRTKRSHLRGITHGEKLE